MAAWEIFVAYDGLKQRLIVGLKWNLSGVGISNLVSLCKHVDWLYVGILLAMLAIFPVFSATKYYGIIIKKCDIFLQTLRN